MVVAKCNYCTKEAVCRSNGVYYCTKHLPKYLIASFKAANNLEKQPKKMKVICDSCDKKFYRNSKKGRLCESCLKKIREKSIANLRKIREQKKLLANSGSNKFDLRNFSKIKQGEYSVKSKVVADDSELQNNLSSSKSNLNEEFWMVDEEDSPMLPIKNHQQELNIVPKTIENQEEGKLIKQQLEDTKPQESSTPPISLDEIYEASLLNKLNKISKEYSGPNSEIMGYLPRLFKLLCNILEDKRTDWNARMLISASLSYFIVPRDIIPDDNSEGGYIDDIFIMLFVLREISQKIDESLIVSNWEGNEAILETIEKLYSMAQSILGSKSSEILDLVGLRKYISADVNYTENNHSEKLRQLVQERDELIGLLAFIMPKIYSTQNNLSVRSIDLRNLQAIKSLIKENENYSEVLRIIALAKQKKISTTLSNFSDDDKLEKELRLRRIKRLLEEK